MKNNHIVYAAFDSKGNCLYVGEGKPDRYKHNYTERLDFILSKRVRSLLENWLNDW